MHNSSSPLSCTDSDSSIEEETPARSRAFCSFNVLDKFPKSVAILVVTTIAVGTIVLMLGEEWDFLTAIYVIAQIVTTIGYGDITVSCDAMRLFMALYVLWVVLMLAYLLNHLIVSNVERHIERIAARLRVVEQKDTEETDAEVKLKWHAFNHVVITGTGFFIYVMVGTFFWGLVNGSPAFCNWSDEEHGCVYLRSEPRNLVQGFYMAVITLTTVGFGDFTPNTFYGRMFAIFWMVTGVICTGFFVKAVQELMFEAQEGLLELHKAMDEQTFRQLDTSGDGRMCRGEFRAYVLVKHGFVTQEIIDIIDRKYDDIVHELQLEGSAHEGITFKQLLKWQNIHKDGPGRAHSSSDTIDRAVQDQESREERARGG